MLIRLGNVSAHVTQANDTELDWLRSYLRWRDPQAKHDARYKSGQWDGSHSVFDDTDHTFPTGLAKLVARGAVKASLRADLEDLREPPAFKLRAVPKDLLRDYQQEAYNAALAPVSASDTGLPGRGILHVGTGGGKTIVASAIAYAVQIPWVFLVNSQDLLDQTAKKYEHFMCEAAGRIGDGEWAPKRFTVATVQTLHKRRRAATQFLADAQGVMVDEVHGSASVTPQEVLARMPNAYYRFGLSATPLGREDKKDLLTVGAIGPVIYKSDAQALHAKDVLAAVDITFVSCPIQPRSYWSKVMAIARHDQRRAYQLAYDIGVIHNQSRNYQVIQVCKEAPKPCLTFVKNISHGHLLKKQMYQAGIRADFVSGDNDSPQRRDAIKRLVYGEIDVLVASGVFYQGVDIPELLSLVNAAAGKSSTVTLQRLGRGTRKSPGKDKVMLYDFTDQGPFLKRHSESRKATYIQAGYKVKEV